MRIDKRSPHGLTVTSRPWRNWFWGGLLALAGLLAWIFLPAAISCSRPGGECSVTRLGQQGFTEEVIPLAALQRAAVAERDRGEGETIHYFTELQTTGGVVPLNAPSAFRAWNENMAGRINRFLQHDGGENLSVTSPLFVFPRLLLPLGLLIIAFGTISTTTFDRTLNRFVIRNRRLLRTSEISGELSEITGFLVSYSRTSRSQRARPGLLMSDMAFMPIAPYRHGVGRSAFMAGVAICEFLGVGTDRVINGWDLLMKPSEQLQLLRGLGTLRDEAEQFRSRLAQEPDVEGFRQLAWRLAALNRRHEARTILESAQRFFMRHDRRAEANRMSALLQELGI
jgi:hypothetical protein